MTRVWITGDKQIEKTLKQLADKAADRVARSALRGGLTVARQAIRKEAPKETGLLRRSVGTRLEKSKPGKPATAKAGPNVGKRPRRTRRTKAAKTAQQRSPHAHLVILGTANRSWKTAKKTVGKMPKNPFVRRAMTGAKMSITARMRERAASALKREIAKARRK